MEINDNDYHKLLGIIQWIIEDTKKKIRDFKCIANNKLLTKKLLCNIEVVYMNSIIIDIAKLINATKSDKAGLKQFKKISPEGSKNKLVELEKSYEDILKKIVSNRNRIIVHIDISDKNSYCNMGFSEEEVNRNIEDNINSIYFNSNDSTIEGFKKSITKDKDNERYSPTDFLIDIPRIKKFLNEFILIINEVRIYYREK